jgi:hypothetical protein
MVWRTASSASYKIKKADPYTCVQRSRPCWLIIYAISLKKSIIEADDAADRSPEPIDTDKGTDHDDVHKQKAAQAFARNGL